MSTIEIQFDKKFDNSRVRRQVDLRCRTDYICTTLLGGIFVFVIFFYAWQQFQWIQYGYDIEAAGSSIDDLAETARQLRIERANLATPQRIERIARARLGMVSPAQHQYVVIEDALSREQMAALYGVGTGAPAP